MNSTGFFESYFLLYVSLQPFLLNRAGQYKLAGFSTYLAVPTAAVAIWKIFTAVRKQLDSRALRPLEELPPGYTLSTQSVAAQLKIPEQRAAKMLHRLKKLGMVEQVSSVNWRAR
ncbi:MAG: hypothetical protein CXZ00_03070 [Acidobacteria bacterium]|nr:MAG: hypothetical protein CXZ00_03070 [Acidobacteriota bacterium]